ncbi:hypothetical protein HDU78_009243 [Chytriomyces hyalinus]|nr:hypothetical protein HDU78_009243 [Chytriomyces hyalinus]
MPISSSSHIPLETGSINISLDDVASILDRLERLQSMFKELEARHKPLSRHTASVNRGLERFTALKEGTPVDDEAALNRVERCLNDSQLKVKEAALLEDRVRVKELEIKGKKVFELQAKVSDQEEQVKLWKAQASLRLLLREMVRWMHLNQPTVNTAPVANSPSHPTPPAAPSFFYFQTLLPTVKSNPPAITTPAATTTPTPTSAVSNAANSDAASPVSPQESTQKSASAVSTLQMKLKLRDLANALNRVTVQRDVDVSLIKQLQDAVEISHASNPSALSITHQSNRRGRIERRPAIASILIEQTLLIGPPSHSNSACIAHGSRPGTIQTQTNTARLLDKYKMREKDLETTLECCENEVENELQFEDVSTVSLIITNLAYRVVSTSSANASSALILPATAEVSDLKAALLEKQEELKGANFLSAYINYEVNFLRVEVIMLPAKGIAETSSPNYSFTDAVSEWPPMQFRRFYAINHQAVFTALDPLAHLKHWVRLCVSASKIHVHIPGLVVHRECARAFLAVFKNIIESEPLKSEFLTLLGTDNLDKVF